MSYSDVIIQRWTRNIQNIKFMHWHSTKQARQCYIREQNILRASEHTWSFERVLAFLKKIIIILDDTFSYVYSLFSRNTVYRLLLLNIWAILPSVYLYDHKIWYLILMIAWMELNLWHNWNFNPSDMTHIPFIVFLHYRLHICLCFFMFYRSLGNQDAVLV